MSKTLQEIAQQLIAPEAVQKTDPEKTKAVKEVKPIPKVQLIYAFNGTGKTRLSREFKQLVAGEAADEDTQHSELATKKILYYSAFTEDLFYWDNDLDFDQRHKLLIRTNSFTHWVLDEQGQDQNVIHNFQRYTNDKLTPRFNEANTFQDLDKNEVTVKAFSEVTFSLESGNAENIGNLKISKGEESLFIWSIFYALLDQAISVLNEVNPDFPERTPFSNLEFVFIDDPVSSLDDNHLIDLGVDLARLIKSNKSGVKFIITTHSPIFFNVLSNELASDDKSGASSWKAKDFKKYRLERNQDGSLDLVLQPNDSPFAYHLHLIGQLQKAIESGDVEKYHFNFLRNVLEKTATFLGYRRWEHLLPKLDDGRPNPTAKRIIDYSSHSKHAGDEIQQLKPEEKKVLEKLLNEMLLKHNFWRDNHS